MSQDDHDDDDDDNNDNDIRNIPHAFVEFTSEVTAQAVADWMLRLDAQR